MKVQQFVQGSKVAQSQSGTPSRAVPKAGAAADAKPSDFANALEDARKKPDPKPAEAEAPAVKKPTATATKKAKSTKNQPQRANDEQPESEEVASDDESSTPLPASTAGEDEAPDHSNVSSDAEDADTPDKSDLPRVNADLSAIAQAPLTGPRLPMPVEDTAQKSEFDGSSSLRPIPICPMPKAPVAGPVAAESTDDASADPYRDGLKPVLEGFEQIVDEAESTADADDDSTNPVAVTKAPSAPLKQTAPTGFLDDAPPPPDIASTTPKPTPAQPLPDISSDAVVADDVKDAPDDVGPTPVMTTAADKDPSIAVPMSHAQLDPAKPQSAPAPTQAPAPPPPQAQFIEQNHPKIVTAMHADLLPHGGTMQIRLDPPELGALQVLVHMQDGVMTASFHTSNDDATKLLSHSLSQLKQVLESQGVSVEKLQVQQSPRDQHAGNDDQRNQPRDQQDDAYRQEQQRKEMLRRMWRKLSIGSDPLDLVA